MVKYTLEKTNPQLERYEIALTADNGNITIFGELNGKTVVSLNEQNWAVIKPCEDMESKVRQALHRIAKYYKGQEIYEDLVEQERQRAEEIVKKIAHDWGWRSRYDY